MNALCHWLVKQAFDREKENDIWKGNLKNP